MPDWISHILFGLIIAEVFTLRKSLVVFGAILPDILLKLGHLRIFFPNIPVESWYQVFFPLHSILGSILVAIIIAPLFEYPMRKVVGLITIGAISHILLDGLARVHIFNVQGFLFYPFSTLNWSLNAVRMENFFIPMIVLFVILVLVKLAKYLMQRKFSVF